jgi:hypothetical protein
VGWGVEMLAESLLAAKWPITLVAFRTLERELGTCSAAGELKDSEHKVGEVVGKDEGGCIHEDAYAKTKWSPLKAGLAVVHR